MCSDQESNQRPFGSQAGAQSTEPHQPGLIFFFLIGSIFVEVGFLEIFVCVCICRLSILQLHGSNQSLDRPLARGISQYRNQKQAEATESIILLQKPEISTENILSERRRMSLWKGQREIKKGDSQPSQPPLERENS